MIKYIDISEHQGIIDFDKVKGSVDGIIIRAGYGAGNTDKQFLRNITECNRLGIPCGAYWFSYAYTVELARAEAQHLIKAIKPFKISLPVAFDWEYDSLNRAKQRGVQPTKQLVSDMARAFLHTCEAAGYYAMNYTNIGLGKQYFDDNVWARYDLWLAQWPNIWTEESKPQMSCGIWQYGGSAVPGITGNVDSNRAYKDYASLIAPKQEQEKTWKDKALEWGKDAGLNIENPDSTMTKAEILQMLMEVIK